MHRWTEQETKYLIVHHYESIGAIARELGLSPISVQHKANRMGLFKNCLPDTGKKDVAKSNVLSTRPCENCTRKEACEAKQGTCPIWNRWYKENHIWNKVTEPFRRLRERTDLNDQRRNDST